MNKKICIRGGIMFIVFSAWSARTAVIQAADNAQEKENYSNILKTAAALQTKPNEYYEKIVADLESRNVLGGDIGQFQTVVSGLFDPIQTEDYHRLSIALYSKGYAEESDLVYRKFVEPSKKFTPEEALAKAQDKLHRYESAKSRVTGELPAAGAAQTSRVAATQASSVAAAPVKQPSFQKNTVFHRLILTNGQSIEGRIAERDAGGLWFETDPGSKVYFSKSEIREEVGLPTGTSK